MRRNPGLLHRRESVWAVGISCSIFGDNALAVAFAVWIKDLTGSTPQAGLAFFAYFAPTLLGPVNGLIADRVRRAKLLICTDVAQAAWLCLALPVHDAGDVWLLYLVLLGIGTGMDLESAAASALLTVVVPTERLGRVNSVFRAAKDFAYLAAPAAGVAVYNGFGPQAVIALDMVTFFVSAYSVRQLRAEEKPPATQRGRARGPLRDRLRSPGPALKVLGRELVAGVSHIAATPVLRRVIIAIATCLLAFGMFEPVSVQLVTQGLHDRAAFLGVLLTAKSLGSVLGGIACVRLVDRLGAGRLVSAGLALMAVGTVMLLPSQILIVLIGCLVIGFGAAMGLIGFLTSIQTHSPQGLQGRVFAAADMSIRIPQSAAMAAGSALIAVTPYQFLLACMAVVTMAAAVALTVFPTRQSLAGNRDGEAIVSRREV